MKDGEIRKRNDGVRDPQTASRRLRDCVADYRAIAKHFFISGSLGEIIRASHRRIIACESCYPYRSLWLRDTCSHSPIQNKLGEQEHTDKTYHT